MIQVINDKGNVFAHVHTDVVWTRQQIRRLIHQVGGKDPVGQSLFVILVKFGQTIGKEEIAQGAIRGGNGILGLNPMHGNGAAVGTQAHDLGSGAAHIET